MKKNCTLLFLCFIVMAPARADLLPPKTKNVPIEYRIETDKEHPDWLFYVVTGNHAVKPVKLSPNSPLLIPGNAAIGNGPVPRPGEKRTRAYRSVALIAIPKDAVKNYPNEEELFSALRKDDVPGLIQSPALNDHQNVPDGSRVESITMNYRLEKLDPKKGIVLTEVGKDDAKSGETPEAVDERKNLVVEAKMEMWIVGVCGAIAIALTGLYFIRRSRSKSRSL